MTSPVSCYESSMWCCLCRAFKRCKNPPKSTEVATIKISGVSFSTEIQPVHHRERTWKLSNGRMTYEVSQAITRARTSE